MGDFVDVPCVCGRVCIACARCAGCWAAHLAQGLSYAIALDHNKNTCRLNAYGNAWPLSRCLQIPRVERMACIQLLSPSRPARTCQLWPDADLALTNAWQARAHLHDDKRPAAQHARAAAVGRKAAVHLSPHRSAESGLVSTVSCASN